MMRPEALLVQSYRMARNAVIDMRYGGLLGLDLKQWRTRQVIDLDNADYGALDQVFAGRMHETDVLVDVGCRKGRLINWALSRGLRNRIIGIELDEEIAHETRRRLQKYENVEVIAGDVITHMPQDGTLFYLYNSFGADVMEAFKAALLKVARGNRNVRVLYYNCIHVRVFSEDPEWDVEMVDLGGGSSARFAPMAVIRLRQEGDTRS